jgi:hypothetical protein
VAQEAMRLAGHKLPLKTAFVVRTTDTPHADEDEDEDDATAGQEETK